MSTTIKFSCKNKKITQILLYHLLKSFVFEPNYLTEAKYPQIHQY